MERSCFAAIAVMVMCVFCACSNAVSNEPTEEKFEGGVFTTAKTEMVEIAFCEGESPFFDVSMWTGSEKDKIIWISFYKAGDIDENGNVKMGATPCRYYQIVLPRNETAKRWGYGNIVAQREDGSEHIIKPILVNQPD